MKVLRQKNYSIFQELYHSGVKRVGKKYLGRLKRSTTEGIRDLSRNQYAKNKKIVRKFNKNEIPDISNRELANKIVRDIRKNGDVRVFDNDKLSKVINEKGNFNARLQPVNNKLYKEQRKLKPNLSRENKKIIEALSNRNNVINLTGNYKDMVATLGHEGGHAMNVTGAAGIDNLANSRLYHINMDKPKPKNLRELINRKLVQYKEESNAWKNGLELLKRNGATKEELRIAKEQRKNALKTYETSALGDIGSMIYKKHGIKGLNSKIGTRFSSVSKSKENIFKALVEKHPNIPKSEIKEMVNNMKTDAQLYRTQKKRRAKRKDKNILREMFGNW